MDVAKELRALVAAASAEPTRPDALRKLSAKLLPAERHSDDPQIALLEGLTAGLLAPSEQVDTLLSDWVNGVQPLPTDANGHAALESWRGFVGLMLELVPALAHGLDPTVLSTDADESGATLAPSHLDERRQISLFAAVARSTPTGAARSRTQTAVRGRRRAASRVLDILARGSPEAISSAVAALPVATTAHLASLAAAAIEALAAAAGEHSVRFRQRVMSHACRLVNAELNEADRHGAPHRMRPLASTLANLILPLRRPHLHKASASHTLIPLLLRWAELLDATARSCALVALRHACDQLPSHEVRWHGALLFDTLKKRLAFREPEALAQLLPTLFAAWPHVTSEHAPGAVSAAFTAAAASSPSSSFSSAEQHAGGGGDAGPPRGWRRSTWTCSR